MRLAHCGAPKSNKGPKEDSANQFTTLTFLIFILANKFKVRQLYFKSAPGVAGGRMLS